VGEVGMEGEGGGGVGGCGNRVRGGGVGQSH